MTAAAPAKPVSAYIICATPRSGSTLLCDLLVESGVAGCPHSYFREEDIGYWADVWGVRDTGDTFDRSYLAAMRVAGTMGTGMFGLRLMRRSVDTASERLARATRAGTDDPVALFDQAFGPTCFIHLSRQDKLAQAISLVRAEQTGLWHVAADGTERERTGQPHDPVFDRARITGARDMLAAEDTAWRDFFDRHAIDPFRLTYEELAADPSATLGRVLTWLGLEPAAARDVDVRSAVMADAESAAWRRRLGAG